MSQDNTSFFVLLSWWAGKNFLMSMSSRNAPKVHFRMTFFFVIGSSIIRVTGQNSQNLKIVRNSFHVSLEQLSESVFSPFLLRLLSPSLYLVDFLSLNAFEFFTDFRLCCPKQDTFLPLTNGEERRRIMFEPCRLYCY